MLSTRFHFQLTWTLGQERTGYISVAFQHAGRVDSIAFSKKSLCQYTHANPNKMYHKGICKDVLKALTFMHFILRTCNLEIIRWKEGIIFYKCQKCGLQILSDSTFRFLTDPEDLTEHHRKKSQKKKISLMSQKKPISRLL